MPNKTQTEENSLHRFTPGKSPYIIFTAMFGPPAALALYFYLFKNEANAFFVGAGMALLLVYSYFWSFDKRLLISSDGVTCGRMPWSRKYLTFSDIEDFHAFTEAGDGKGGKGSLRKLVLKPKPGAGKEAIVILFNLFSMADAKAILEILSKRLPGDTSKLQP